MGSQDFMQKVASPHLDREFMITCFEVASSWWDVARRKTLFTPRVLFLQAMILHDLFLELFKTIGRTEQLLAAMRQAFMLSAVGTIEKLGREKDIFGKIKSFDDSLTFYKHAITPKPEVEPDADADGEVDRDGDPGEE